MEDARHREVCEEVELEVRDLRYLGTLENLFTREGSPGHEIVHVFDGEFVDDPTQLEAVAYFAYWTFVVLVWWGLKTGKIEVVLRPLRAVWRALTRQAGPETSGAEQA